MNKLRHKSTEEIFYKSYNNTEQEKSKTTVLKMFSTDFSRFCYNSSVKIKALLTKNYS